MIAKLAKARWELLTPSDGGGGGGSGGAGFDVARTGIASVGFVGFLSVGKACTIILPLFWYLIHSVSQCS